MNLQTKLKRILDLLEKNPGALAFVGKEAKALEPKLTAILDSLESWNGTDPSAFAEMEIALAKVKVKGIPSLNARLKKFGFAINSASKQDKTTFLTKAAKSKEARAIVAELTKPEPNPIEEAFYELAKLTSGADARIQKLPDAEMKKWLTYLQIKAPTKPGKKAFDRNQANQLVSARVRDTGLRIRN
ncbi:MAG: hypothetical protein JNM27_02510 [Leptospirales bacterium]|nr:hypothetical protein [Leptospirales bacterium]